VSGPSPLFYQWYRNETVIGGATAANYTTPPVTTNDIGAAFKVTVSNAYGAVTSSVATLTVTPYPGVSAAGGTVTNYTLNGTNWTAHVFTTVGTTSIAFAVGGNVEYLVIGGGGGGGGSRAGGGGAGGYRCSVQGELSGSNSPAESVYSVSAGTYSIGVGDRGTGGVSTVSGTAGGNSWFADIVARGGGGGKERNNPTNAVGGSGGGGGYLDNTEPQPGGSGTAGQGFRGGSAVGNADGFKASYGGGGGGAGSPGTDGKLISDPWGSGGTGLVSSITGGAVMRAGGGGGGQVTWGVATNYGGGVDVDSRRDGAISTGGGGAARWVGGSGGNGGSGIVIVRYIVGSGGATALTAPTALVATPVNTHQIQLAWTDNATNETAYVLDRSLDGSAWNAPTSLAANATAYTDDGLAAGTQYYYRLAATNSDGLSAYASATAMTFSNPPPSAIQTSASSVNVPEGGTNTFQIWLSSQPTSDVTVAVAWASGDTSITVTGGASLTFTTNNWATYQTVTLAASEDADAANGSATITCSGAGLTSGSVTATELDNDTTLTVTAGAGGNTTPTGAAVVAQGAATGISATAGAGYAFANWSVISGAAAVANSNAANTTVTISAPATIHANFIHVAILTSAPFVGVPEGGTAKFRVSLTVQPAGSVTVSVAHGGDSQLSVVSGGSLVFSTSDWNLWKTVTLADAEDVVTNRRVATFTCSAAGMDSVTVTATGIDNDGPVPVDSDGDGLPDAREVQLGRVTNTVETLTALPFAERFESDTVSLGLLHGQHNWVVSPANAATVEAGDVFEGTRALQIQGTNDASVALSQAFTSTPQTVWWDLRSKVAGAAIPVSVPDAATVFFFNDAGQLVVCDGARPAGFQWVTLTNPTPRQAGSWARLTARADYVLQTWSLYLDGTNVAANLGFAMPQKRLTCIALEGATAVVDNLTVGYGRSDGIPGSNNLASDDWYLDYLGTLAYGDTDDPDHDGMNNLAEYLGGTNPNDITSLLEMTEAVTTPANPGELIVRWQSATGRVYTLQAATNLMTGFSLLTNGIPATPTVNVYTDTVNGVGQKFYRVEVE
jgi:hypothetical protein